MDRVAAPIVVADVGGTNARVALARDGAVRPESVQRFENDRFGSFDEVLARYLQRTGTGALGGCCIAVAGPVTPGRARLTNRDWFFESGRIGRLLPPGSTRAVHLLNDLAALGHALPALGPAQLRRIRPGRDTAGNGQSLVVGIGTGFNVCLVRRMPSGLPAVIEAELGHAGLPARIADDLRRSLGRAADGFRTIEDCFSGPGLAALDRAVAGADADAGAGAGVARISAAAGPAGDAGTALFARLLGRLARELVFHYLPQGGMFFAGGVARAILGGPGLPEFLQALDQAGRLSDIVRAVPVSLINDDVAALTGAARYAAGQRPTA